MRNSLKALAAGAATLVPGCGDPEYNLGATLNPNVNKRECVAELREVLLEDQDTGVARAVGENPRINRGELQDEWYIHDNRKIVGIAIFEALDGDTEVIKEVAFTPNFETESFGAGEHRVQTNIFDVETNFGGEASMRGVYVDVVMTDSDCKTKYSEMTHYYIDLDNNVTRWTGSGESQSGS